MSRARANPRRITVGGAEYAWIVRSQELLFPGLVLVDVYAAGDRGKGRHLHVRMRFDDPWVNFGPLLTTPPDRAGVWALDPVKPGLVAAWIGEARATGWNPALRGPPLRRAWIEGRLCPE